MAQSPVPPEQPAKMTVWSVYAGWYDDDVKAKQRLFLEESDAEDYRKKLFDEGWDFCTKEPMEVH